MVKNLNNYFDDWIRVEFDLMIVPSEKQKEMINFCVSYFGNQGGVWDRAKERTTDGKIKHYFRFKYSEDALLFRLQFGNI